MSFLFVQMGSGSWHIMKADQDGTVLIREHADQPGHYLTYCGRKIAEPAPVFIGLPDDGKSCESCFRAREAQQDVQ